MLIIMLSMLCGLSQWEKMLLYDAIRRGLDFAQSNVKQILNVGTDFTGHPKITEHIEIIFHDKIQPSTDSPKTIIFLYYFC